MKTRIITFLSALITLPLLSSCQQDDPQCSFSEEDTFNMASDEDIGIDGNSIDISESDAITVANIFAKQNYGSRAASKIVKNVVPINASAGTPALYVVNFTDGYVIVSATKKMVPILAEVEHGTFSLSDEPFGRDVLISEYINEYMALRDTPANEKIRALWLKYDKLPKRENLKSRAVSAELSDARYEFICSLEDQDYIVLTKDQMLEDFPPSIAEQFLNTVERKTAHFYEETGQSAAYAAVYAIKESSSYSSYHPVKMTTTWGQGKPYNGAYDDGGSNLGCVTIAVAQLMKYYQNPPQFNWAAMPNSLKGKTPEYSPTLVSFLSQLKAELKVSSSGGASIDDAVRVLKSYGYDASVTTSRYNVPSYARGWDSSKKVGHAWIVAGYRSINYITKYVLFFPNDDFLPEYRYIENSSHSFTTYGNSEYMNWGWDGDYDGWYYNGDIRINRTDGVRDYSSDRKYIKIEGR